MQNNLYCRKVGHARLPFKISAKFPIGLLVILQTQFLKKIKTTEYLMCKIILTVNSLEFKIELLLK